MRADRLTGRSNRRTHEDAIPQRSDAAERRPLRTHHTASHSAPRSSLSSCAFAARAALCAPPSMRGSPPTPRRYQLLSSSFRPISRRFPRFHRCSTHLHRFRSCCCCPENAETPRPQPQRRPASPGEDAADADDARDHRRASTPPPLSAKSRPLFVCEQKAGTTAKRLSRVHGSSSRGLAFQVDRSEAARRIHSHSRARARYRARQRSGNVSRSHAVTNQVRGAPTS